MPVRIGLNGFGRIGRYLTRLLAGETGLELVAVNARADNAQLAHLLRYDSVHGRFTGTVEADGDGFTVGGRRVRVVRGKPGAWQWGDLGVDIVVESTGAFRDRASCEAMLASGCGKVVISAPGQNPDRTIVMGVNDHELLAEDRIISNASCTTNCLAPVALALHEAFGVERGLMTTIHAYTMSQRILDGTHKDLRRARAAAVNMLPTTTGAAKAVAQVIPALAGRLDGMAVRVPTPDGSLVDLTVELGRDTSAHEINEVLRRAATERFAGIMGYSDEPLVSSDYIGTTYAGVVDGLCTSVMRDRLAKVIIWYDNESGFTNQLLRLVRKVAHMAEGAQGM
ncbi:MAG: type I glyceraldehyde-3-phosphate dehydrogenase [Desulfovibrionaceae bacterium]